MIKDMPYATVEQVLALREAAIALEAEVRQLRDIKIAAGHAVREGEHDYDGTVFDSAMINLKAALEGKDG